MTGATEQSIRISSERISRDVFELKIEGYLDFSSSERVEQAIEQIFSQNVFKLVVDLSATKYISSAGFGCFISAIDTAMKNNGDMIFTGTPHDIKDIFDILGLSKILRFTGSRDEALKLFAEMKTA